MERRTTIVNQVSTCKKKMMSVWGLNLPLAQHETDVPNNYRSLEPIP